MNHDPRGRRRCRGVLVLSGAWGVLLSAQLCCSGDTTGPAPLPAMQAYWALQLNQHAVNLALTAPAGQPVYDTVQLTATAFNQAGAHLLGVDSTVHYSDPDSSITISSTGLVTAHYVTSSTQVVASLTWQGVTLADTAFIQVTQVPYRLATFSIQPQPDGLDSAKFAIDAIKENEPSIPVYATIANGNALTDTVCDINACQLMVYFTSSDPSIATIDREYGTLTALEVGHVTFYATTLAYGVFKRDSLPFVIGYPLNLYEIMAFQFTEDFEQGSSRPEWTIFPKQYTIGVGGSMLYQNFGRDPINVVFDDSSQVEGGNIPQLPDIRTFPLAGTYHFRDTGSGIGGTVIVSSGP